MWAIMTAAPAARRISGHDVLRDLVDKALHHLLGQGDHVVPQGDEKKLPMAAPTPPPVAGVSCTGTR